MENVFCIIIASGSSHQEVNQAILDAHQIAHETNFCLSQIQDKTKKNANHNNNTIIWFKRVSHPKPREGHVIKINNDEDNNSVLALLSGKDKREAIPLKVRQSINRLASIGTRAGTSLEDAKEIKQIATKRNHMRRAELKSDFVTGVMKSLSINAVTIELARSKTTNKRYDSALRLNFPLSIQNLLADFVNTQFPDLMYSIKKTDKESTKELSYNSTLRLLKILHEATRDAIVFLEKDKIENLNDPKWNERTHETQRSIEF